MDPTPFFGDFKDAKNYFFQIFSYCLHVGTWYSVFNIQSFNILLKFCVKILFCKHYFSPLNTERWKKGKDLDPEARKHADPQYWFLTIRIATSRIHLKPAMVLAAIVVELEAHVAENDEEGEAEADEEVLLAREHAAFLHHARHQRVDVQRLQQHKREARREEVLRADWNNLEKWQFGYFNVFCLLLIKSQNLSNLSLYLANFASVTRIAQDTYIL